MIIIQIYEIKIDKSTPISLFFRPFRIIFYENDFANDCTFQLNQDIFLHLKLILGATIQMFKAFSFSEQVNIVFLKTKDIYRVEILMTKISFFQHINFKLLIYLTPSYSYER